MTINQSSLRPPMQTSRFQFLRPSSTFFLRDSSLRPSQSPQITMLPIPPTPSRHFTAARRRRVFRPAPSYRHASSNGNPKFPHSTMPVSSREEISTFMVNLTKVVDNLAALSPSEPPQQKKLMAMNHSWWLLLNT